MFFFFLFLLFLTIMVSKHKEDSRILTKAHRQRLSLGYCVIPKSAFPVYALIFHDLFVHV